MKREWHTCAPISHNRSSSYLQLLPKYASDPLVGLVGQ
ncbi:unnamed protein product [Spirodela intermedia]|uniref:Uncharacterized protein n=2 Tax=Spirodela intermedia TaxID=51605 RepID=A0A7I8KW69_SPIIN|nr:unnamed protein product [Spirodela intermedia]CAA7401851.1 unnamed protein product [Spirodela intermedia]